MWQQQQIGPGNGRMPWVSAYGWSKDSLFFLTTCEIR